VGVWTRELINAALSVDGSYYLPYQLHGTLEQFLQCYPKAEEFFALKNKYDPQSRFRNKFWQKYVENKNLSQENRMINESSEFKSVYSSTNWSDKFYYRIYPEDKFHYLIKDSTQRYKNDKEIYQHIQQQLPTIKPFLADIFYALPALVKQKKEIAKQTIALLGKDKVIKGYVEIGSTGRYISVLKKCLSIQNPIYLINDLPPSYSPVDIFERGSIFKFGQYIPYHLLLPVYCR